MIHIGSYLQNVEIKNYNVMINRENFFDQSIKDNKVTYENIRKITTGRGDDYKTGCLLDYPYFRDRYKMIRDSYKMIAVDLRRQQVLDADPIVIQQINFTANLDRANNTRVYFIWKNQKKLNLISHKAL